MTAPPLERLGGYSFSILHSAGFQTQAQAMAERCGRAYRYLTRILGFNPTFRLLLLAPDDWGTYASFPLYGMPHTARAKDLVVGVEPAEFWQGVMQMLADELTPTQRTDLEAVYGTVDGRLDIAPFADLLVVHELAHLFHEQVPFMFPRLWLTEFFANLCLHSYLSEHEPERMPIWLGLPQRMMTVPLERVKHRSLADFERLYVGVGPVNYVWYEFRLVVAIKALYDAAGVEAVGRLYRTFALHKGNITDQHLAESL